jgi:drug/metabolite transporter (DMT)-like permease
MVLLTQSRKGTIALVVLAWTFATMGIFARYLSGEFALFEQVYLRIGLAFLVGILAFYPRCNFKKIYLLPKKDFFVLVLRSICLYVGVVMITAAFLHTKYSNATFAASLPVMPLLGFILLKERIKIRTVFFILLGFFGLALMVFKDLQITSVGQGEILAFGSLLFFDLSYVGRKLHSDYLNNYENTVFMFAIGAIFLFSTSMMIGETLPTMTQFSLLTIAVLALAAICNVANLFLTNYGFQNVKVAVASNILTLEAVFALLYGIFLFREIPTLYEWIGSILILLSVFLVNKSEQ